MPVSQAVCRELATDLIWENVQIDRNRDGKIQEWVLEGRGHQDTIIRR